MVGRYRRRRCRRRDGACGHVREVRRCPANEPRSESPAPAGAGARAAAERLVRIMSGPGYPGFYFPATALLILALRRLGARGSEALVIASVGGWAIHRFIKLFAHRRRPRSMTGRSNELEAFPSGHTSATTAIALTTAHVLAKQHLVPLPIAILIAVAIPLTIGLGRVLSDEPLDDRRDWRMDWRRRRRRTRRDDVRARLIGTLISPATG